MKKRDFIFFFCGLLFCLWFVNLTRLGQEPAPCEPISLKECEQVAAGLNDALFSEEFKSAHHLAEIERLNLLCFGKSSEQDE